MFKRKSRFLSSGFNFLILYHSHLRGSISLDMKCHNIYYMTLQELPCIFDFHFSIEPEQWSGLEAGSPEQSRLSSVPGVCPSLFFIVSDWALSQGGEHVFCVKHLFFSILLLLILLLCALFRCISVNGFFNPWCLPLSLSHQRGWGKGE